VLKGFELLVFPGTVEVLVEKDGDRIVEHFFDDSIAGGDCSSWYGHVPL